MPVPITPFGIVACILIAALLGFWLFAPTGMVAKSLNWFGGLLQKGFAAVKGLFGKK